MSIYLKIVSFIMLASATFGFLLPAMFSTTSTELVLLGFVVLAIILPVLFFIVKSIVTDITKKFNKGDKKHEV